MRRSMLFALIAGLGPAWGIWSGLAAGGDPNTGSAEPVITSIWLEGTNVVVLARVPGGISKVTLEGCRRLEGEAWTPKAVGRSDGAGGEMTFRLAQSPDLELLRIRADAREALPGFFYKGPTSFSGQPVSGSGFVSSGVPGAARGAGGEIVAFDNAAPPASPGGLVQARSVTESDIWEISGDTLYFFNQYRGLQVIDVSEPDAPVVRGVLPIAAVGEQMYLLDDAHLALLARDGCDGGSAAQSQVVVVEIRAGKPAITASLPVQGSIKESRLVGSALYVAADVYRKVVSTNTLNGAQWEWGSLLSSFDLSLPNQPIARSTEWAPGYGNIVSATGRFLFVAGQQAAGGATGFIIRVFDISAPDGTLAELSAIRPMGQVKDKFKMNLDGEVFTVVSEIWAGAQTTTYVETFSLKNPVTPEKLGLLKLSQGESLFATRFDRNRLYAVTFLRIDPLWVVDLSDPTQPKVAGELQVPGWSTYIHPLGDRLVAIGRDNTAGWRTSVSLFDVRDAAHPALLSRVFLGEQNSSSEAELDEKALGVLPDAGLVLVPFSSSTSGGNFQGVQLIDLSRDALALRGRIEQPIEARRATLHRDRVLSLSGLEILSVDATDRDHPVIRAGTPLSWPVDRVFLSGPYLLELDQGLGTSSATEVRVASAEDPDQLLNRLSLTNLPFLGAALRGDHLYIARGRPAEVHWQWFQSEQTNRPVSTNWGVFSLVILELSQLPGLTVSGEVEVSTADTYLGNLEALWPEPGLLVWKSSGYNYWLYPYWPMARTWPGNSILAGGIPVTGWLDTVAAPGAAFFAPLYWPGSPGRLIGFDVKDSTAPRLASELSVGSDAARNLDRRGFAADGLVYLSHREYESQTTGTNYYVYTNTVVETVTNVVTVSNVVRVPLYTTVTNLETRAQVRTLALRRRLFSASEWPGTSSRAGMLAGGAYHSLLNGPQGSAWAWGANWFGQLGNGANLAQRESLEQVLDLDTVISLAAGQMHSLALRSDGTVWAWGADIFGQLGNGVSAPTPDLPPLPDCGSTIPVPVLDLSNVAAVAAGAYHNLALKTDGKVWSWGANWSGQLGDGTTNDQFAPKMVSGLGDIRALAGGAFHSLAVKRDGTVWAWGRNDFGQLGNNSMADSTRPTPVRGLPEANAVAGGSWHSLALMSAGTVWGWGRNDSGQLGNGGAADGSPAPITGLSNVVALAAGRAHNLALKSDGTVWTWGADDHGQLGDGANVERGTPALVRGLTDALAVTAGANFSLALTRDGTLWTWGDNSHGQLGDGEPLAVTNDVPWTNIIVVTTWTTVTNYTLRTNYTDFTRWVVRSNAVPIVQWFEHHYLDVVDYATPTNPVVRTPVNIPGELQGIAYDGALLYTVGQRAATGGGADREQWLDATAYDGVEAHLVDSLPWGNQWSPPVLVSGATVFLARPAPDTNSAPQLESWTLPDTGKFIKLSSAALTQPGQCLAAFDDLIAVQSSNDFQLFDAGNPAALTSIGSGGPPGCVGFSLYQADGSATRGLWLPLGPFGVYKIGLSHNPAAP